MADIIKKVAYFAMDIPNKPGEGARVLEKLAGAGVNLLAFLGFPSGRKAQLEFIPRGCSGVQESCQGSKDQDSPSEVRVLSPGG